MGYEKIRTVIDDINGEEIWEGLYAVTILVKCWTVSVLDNDMLSWHDGDDNDERYLTLGEIYQQVKALGDHGTITVIYETPLSGTIYQCGNYAEGEWVIHGTTKGYA